MVDRGRQRSGLQASIGQAGEWDVAGGRRVLPDDHVEETLDLAGLEAAFLRLRDTAVAFDTRLRAGFTESDLASLDSQLHHLAANAGADDALPPWPAPTPTSGT